MQTKRVICFDLNGTLLKVNHQAQTKEALLAEAGYNPALVSAVIRSVLMTRECFVHVPEAVAQSRSLTYEESYWLLVQQLYLRVRLKGLPVIFETDTFRQKFIQLWQEENRDLQILPGVLPVLGKLECEPGNRLVLVSNISSIGMQEAEVFCGNLLAHFDKLYMSCNQQAAKPDPYVWQWVKEAFPGSEEYWMVGDDPVMDLAVPKAMGWQTIRVDKDGVEIGKVLEIINRSRA